MKNTDLPAALRSDSMEQAASDARHIAGMAALLFETPAVDKDSPVPGVLWVIRDLAEILAWNLDRLHFEQRSKP